MVNDIVDAAEVVGGLNDVVYIYSFICDADSVGFKDVSCLFVCELAALYVVGVVCEVYLGTVIDASV